MGRSTEYVAAADLNFDQLFEGRFIQFGLFWWPGLPASDQGAISRLLGVGSRQLVLFYKDLFRAGLRGRFGWFTV